MTEREQFEKEFEEKHAYSIQRHYDMLHSDFKKNHPSVYHEYRRKAIDEDYRRHLESKLSTLREDITAEAIMLIKEYALCPDEKLTGDAIKLKRKIIEAMGGDKLSKVREREKMVTKYWKDIGDLEDLKQILGGKDESTK